LDLDLLAQSIEKLLAHHDALRIRFEKTSDEWVQINCSVAEITAGVNALLHFDFAKLSVAEQKTAIEQAVAELHHSFDLSQPPLLRIAFFDLGDRQPSQL